MPEKQYTTEDFIIELFDRVDAAMREVGKHEQAKLYPSEIVTLALLFVLKGKGKRAFHRWLVRDWQPLFPALPERTHLFRLFKAHREWAARFLMEPTILGVADPYGIELIHPMREGRSPHQIGKQGKSNHRWRVGGKLAFVLNKWGLIVAWTCAKANVPDNQFQSLVAQFLEQMIVLTDTGFHSKAGDPANRKVCPRGSWNVRMGVETVLSRWTVVCEEGRRGIGCGTTLRRV